MLTLANATAGRPEPGSGAPSEDYACCMGARMTAWAGLATAATLLLAGCGSDDDGKADDTSSPSVASSESSTAASAAPSATTTPAPAGMRACTEVWQAGAKLPRAYRGCADGAGLLVAPDRIGCSSGQALVRHQRFWAVAGGPIARTAGPLLDDEAYAAALTSCRG